MGADRGMAGEARKAWALAVERQTSVTMDDMHQGEAQGDEPEGFREKQVGGTGSGV